MRITLNQLNQYLSSQFAIEGIRRVAHAKDPRRTEARSLQTGNPLARVKAKLLQPPAVTLAQRPGETLEGR
jgi:hypothetical protein